MKVKICGITNLADARYAAALGVDFLGFIQDTDSKRFIEPGLAAEIIEWVAGPETVGVFVNQDAAHINAVAKKAGFDWIQLHGNESVGLCSSVTLPIIKAFVIRSSDTAESLRIRMTPYSDVVRYFLLDAYDERMHGGTGKSIDRTIARELAQSFPVFLAGGLRPENIIESVRAVEPAGVDVSSGLEETVGKKDFAKLDAFIDALSGERLIGESA